MRSVNINTNDDTIVINNTDIGLVVTGATNVQWNPTTYIDNPNSISPIFNFPDTGTYYYSVYGITDEGCSDTDQIKILVVNEIQLFVPTVFSPNGDGLNDFAKIIQAGYGSLEYFRIYDRWGEQVFYTTNFKIYWDGTINNRQSPMDTYMWMAGAKNIKGERRVFKGDITLVR
jgi:gliding motility-associated-like protein